ncbi:FAR-17a/AIG1-like protein [Caenorhabditis elegans]|uniref:FAR-17a/AIG1-like protein n=1 Tax=Caenorhabditis elegans TaxID=6239 RepID=A4F305_CAEEL|nr:FAR-17a/AIG1-like protein [Caenorhabditis elegans]CCD61146.1 FAR-17a/AIG1-like protein [Caenorhabditis elegans]|eukprot:NP_510865.1 Uncharacterized protein CELE_cTel55X.1 [Caenorhabditis elegans]
MIKVIFHLVSAVLYAAVCYRDTTIVTGALLPIPYQTWSRFVWLTIIDLYMQLLYHTIGFILAVVSPNKRHIIFDYWARALTGPIGVAVTVLFWGLFLFDPATLARDEMAMKILTLFWFNHGLHTLPAITAHLDLAIYNHTSFSTSAILKGIAVFVTLYLIDLHYVFYTSGFWAYPILGELAAPFRLVFIAACMFIVYLGYVWLSFLGALVHGVEKPKNKKRN